VPAEWSFTCQTWTVEDGLPQNSVRAIVQTREGYLWIGTGCGLAQFDGVAFRKLGLGEGLPSLKIRVLLEDKQGALWVGTANGLSRLKAGRVERWAKQSGLAGDAITALAEDREDAIWVGTTTGLSRWRDNRFEAAGLEAGLGDRWVRDLATDQHGNVWVVAQNQGLMRWDGKTFVAATDSPEIQRLRPYQLLRDHTGRMWANEMGRVFCIAGSTLRTYGTSEGLPPVMTTCLAESADGTIWVGTNDQGLYGLRDERFWPVRKAEGLSDDAVRAVVEDREKNLWVGTRGGGLDRLRPRQVVTRKILEGSTEVLPVSLAESPDGSLWVGTIGHSLFRLRGQTQENLPYDKQTPHDLQVGPVLVARDGTLWFGAGAALFQWQNGKLQSVFRGNLANCLCEHRQEGLWVGSLDGVLRLLRQGQFVVFTNGLPAAPLTALVQAADGTLWIGSYGKGLGRFKDGRCEVLDRAQGLLSDLIVTLCLDSQGVLWVGTEGGGLSCVKDGSIRSFGRQNGLVDDTVLQILEDKATDLWLGSHHGIFRITRGELNDLASGRLAYIHPRVFGRSDGMESEECAGGPDTCVRTREGLLCFSTGHGIVLIDPKQIADAGPAPTVRLEEVLVGGRPEPLPAASVQSNHAETLEANRLIIPPGRRRFEFHYTGLYFSAPEKIRFRYRMNGLDTDWVEAGASRVACYNYLPPGHYRFEVVAHNGNSVWSATGAGVALTVRPQFWQTWWFIALALAALSGSIAGTVRLIEKRKARAQMQRLELERAMERERTRIARDIHDDLGARLTMISMLSDKAEREAHEGKTISEYVRDIQGAAREMFAQLDETVWAVNPHNDRLDRLAEYIIQYTERFFRHTPMRCRIKMSGDVPATTIAAEQRHNLFLAIKEALNNAARHSAAKDIQVEISFANGVLAVSVRDNGAGFAAGEGEAPGHGLKNMRSRMENLGGHFELQTRPGQGTNIRLEFDTRSAGHPRPSHTP
jgi:ligand-binding sensor domain-containing protein/signal transduction histidine kinase